MEIEAFAPLRAKLAELQQEAAAKQFDIDTPEGEKAARSYVYKLRQARAAVETARKAEKADILQRGRDVDAQAKLIMDAMTEMVDFFWKPIKAREDAEANRLTRHLEELERLRELATLSNEPTTIHKLKGDLHELEKPIGAEWQEFMARAVEIQTEGIPVLEQEIKRLEKLEADQAELAELRKIQEEQDRKANEERIRKQAKVDAEADTKKREEAAKQEVRDAYTREEQRKQELADEEARFEAARQADVEHRGQVESEIMEAMDATIQAAAGMSGYSHEIAEMIVAAIVSGEVPHVSIAY